MFYGSAVLKTVYLVPYNVETFTAVHVILRCVSSNVTDKTNFNVPYTELYSIKHISVSES